MKEAVVTNREGIPAFELETNINKSVKNNDDEIIADLRIESAPTDHPG